MSTSYYVRINNQDKPVGLHRIVNDPVDFGEAVWREQEQVWEDTGNYLQWKLINIDWYFERISAEDAKKLWPEAFR